MIRLNWYQSTGTAIQASITSPTKPLDRQVAPLLALCRTAGSIPSSRSVYCSHDWTGLDSGHTSTALGIGLAAGVVVCSIGSALWVWVWVWVLGVTKGALLVDSIGTWTQVLICSSVDVGRMGV